MYGSASCAKVGVAKLRDYCHDNVSLEYECHGIWPKAGNSGCHRHARILLYFVLGFWIHRIYNPTYSSVLRISWLTVKLLMALIYPTFKVQVTEIFVDVL